MVSKFRKFFPFIEALGNATLLVRNKNVHYIY